MAFVDPKKVGRVIADYLAKNGISKAGAAAGIAKGLTNAAPYLLLSKAIEEIPGIGNVYRGVWDKLTDAHIAVTKNTVGKIPGIGKIITKGSEWLAKGVKGLFVNNPGYYENLGIHTKYSIPGGYDNELDLVPNESSENGYSSGAATMPSCATMLLADTPVGSYQKRASRAGQFYSLVKGIRGLATTTYTEVDIANYENFVNEVSKLYYKVEQLINRAHAYEVDKSNMPMAMIRQLGFDPADVKHNLADYQTLLTDMHQFLNIDCPAWGDRINRTRDYSRAILMDTQRKGFGTYIQFSWQIIQYATPTTIRQWTFAPNSQLTLEYIVDVFETMQEDRRSNSNWKTLIADIIGAFGKEVVWNDKIELTSNFLSKACYKEDALEILKNADLLAFQVELLTGVAQDPVVPLENFSSGTWVTSTGKEVGYNDILSSEARLRVNYYGSSSVSLTDSTVQIAGSKSTYPTVAPRSSVIVPNRTLNTIISLRKDKYSEGEFLEMQTFRGWLSQVNISLSNQDKTATATMTYNVVSIALMGIVVDQYNAVNGTYENYFLRNTIINAKEPSLIQNGIKMLSLWSFVDWLPACFFSFSNGETNTILNPLRSAMLWDVDSMAECSQSSIETARKLITYSLFSPQIKAGGKRIDNIIEVYNGNQAR